MESGILWAAGFGNRSHGLLPVPVDSAVHGAEKRGAAGRNGICPGDVGDLCPVPAPGGSFASQDDGRSGGVPGDVPDRPEELRAESLSRADIFSLHRFAGAVAEMVYDNLYYFIGNTDYMTARPDLSFALYVGVCGIYLAAELLFMGSVSGLF